jgi:hypothetical protein
VLLEVGYRSDLALVPSPEGSSGPSPSCFSRPSFWSKPPDAPGVLGAFVEPNEANAPEPSPNADDAPADGGFAV